MNKRLKYDIVIAVVEEEDIFKTSKCFVLIDFLARMHA